MEDCMRLGRTVPGLVALRHICNWYKSGDKEHSLFEYKHLEQCVISNGICAALLEAVSGVPKAAWYSYVGAYYFHKCSALFFFTRWLLRCLIFHLCRLFSTTPTCTPNSPSFPPHRPARSPTMSPMMPDPRYHTNSLTHPPAFHVGNSLWAPEEFCKGVWCMDGWGWGWGWGQKWDRGWLRVGAETGWSWMGLARGGAGKNWLELVGTARD